RGVMATERTSARQNRPGGGPQSSSNMDGFGIPPSGCRRGVSIRWDLPAGKMSRMAHGGFGLEVDPHVVMEESEQALSSVELDQPDEVDWTQVWRLDQFLALGFDVVRSSLMADDPGVDLAQARKLVALGCPLETALPLPRVPLARPGKKMTGGRGYGARPAYEAVATKGDATASYLWCGGSDPGSLCLRGAPGG